MENIAQPTKSELDAKNLADLKKHAATLSVAGAYKMKKPELIKAVLKAQKKAAKATEQPAAAASTVARTAPAASSTAPVKEAFKFNKKQEKVLADANITKSEKFRALHNLNVPTAEIARATGSRYSFVFGALNRKVAEVAVA